MNFCKGAKICSPKKLTGQSPPGNLIMEGSREGRQKTEAVWVNNYERCRCMVPMPNYCAVNVCYLLR